MMLEYGLLILIIVVFIAAYLILKTIKHFIVNTVLGIILLVLANALFGLNIAYTWIVFAICAIGGIPGAIVILILNQLNVAFLK